MSLGIVDEEEMYRINVFDWQTAFPEIVPWGGFDAVIGNPPYVRQELLGSDAKAYFQRTYETYNGSADLYVYFIEKAEQLLKSEGKFAYIVANKWMRANYGKPIRKWLTEKHIDQIIDFGDLPVFQTATAYPCILHLSKQPKQSTFGSGKYLTDSIIEK
jgi:type I restriction-modification system DNA methylase subunit